VHDDVAYDVAYDVADDMADGVADDDAPASSSTLQQLTKQLHASAFLAIFTDWQHSAYGNSTVTLPMVRTDLLKCARRFSYNRGSSSSSSSSRSSSVALVKYVMLKLTYLMRRERVTLATANLQDSTRIITAWQSFVAACSERARQKLQQVCGTLPSCYCC
jgi:hypothetical protein